METILYITIYLVGCALAYARLNAGIWCIEHWYFKKYGLKIQGINCILKSFGWISFFIMLTSWGAFLAGFFVKNEFQGYPLFRFKNFDKN
jgi:hypothetical protein